jgi:uncharacterized protein (TIGR02996 family)
MTNDALLDAILADPDDDSPRLVYADWLDERGNPRGEFIRVQCELARLPKYDTKRAPIETREQELLNQHGAEWAQPVASIAREYQFHRGFIDTVSIGGRKLLTHGTKLFQASPLQHVKVFRLGSGGSAADLADFEFLTRIRGLTLQGNIAATDLRKLVTAPGLKKLQALALEFYVSDDALDVLLSGSLPRLEALDLSAGGTLTASHIKSLGKARWAKNLRRLNLRNHREIRVGGVQELAAAKNLTGLVSLNLWDCGAGVAGTQALANSPNAKNLVSLDLRRNRLSETAIRSLAESPYLTSLMELYLGMNDFGAEGVRMLVNWPGLARLRLLHLYDNAIGDDGACALAASPHASNLCYLDVSSTGMGDRGVQALAESPYLQSLRRIDMPGPVGLGRAARRAFDARFKDIAGRIDG